LAKYLIKASDDVLSHCTCLSPLAAVPGQLDCPWCGCGWLICCAACGKAFTFASVIEIDLTYRQIIEADFKTRGIALESGEAEEMAATLSEMMAPLDLESTVVYLDGCFLRVDDTDVRFDGLFARHELSQLPHSVALEKSVPLAQMLGNVDYWLDRELANRDEAG
jgi:hypothetical protein